VTFSCVNVPDAELGAIVVTRDRGVVYFFAMSTSFTKAALGAEGIGRDVDLFIGNGFARGHAEHTLAMLRDMPPIRALFERRYG
jgi:L-erythro-3,5-diaminohexanoate dehydrogenase